MTLPLFPQQELGPVQRGDIFALGRHRLACIDATNKADVARLFDGRKPTLVVTSPPYARQRIYDSEQSCWTQLVSQALLQMPDEAQLFINLGLVYQNGSLLEYWRDAFGLLAEQGWRVFANYVWHKTRPLPGCFGGRLNPAHEFIWHLNKQSPTPTRWVTCSRKKEFWPTKMRRLTVMGATESAKATATTKKIANSVFTAAPARTLGRDRHPAPFPVTLPQHILRSYSKHCKLVYDPFGGSGTTLLACEEEGVDGLAAEISLQYVQLAIDRWRKLHPDKPVTRVTAPAQDLPTHCSAAG